MKKFIAMLMVLGLVEGTEIELASAAIGGDPIEFRMFGNAISLRRATSRATNGRSCMSPMAPAWLTTWLLNELSLATMAATISGSISAARDSS